MRSRLVSLVLFSTLVSFGALGCGGSSNYQLPTGSELKPFDKPSEEELLAEGDDDLDIDMDDIEVDEADGGDAGGAGEPADEGGAGEPADEGAGTSETSGGAKGEAAEAKSGAEGGKKKGR